jgi:hypothetical protein
VWVFWTCLLPSMQCARHAGCDSGMLLDRSCVVPDGSDAMHQMARHSVVHKPSYILLLLLLLLLLLFVLSGVAWEGSLPRPHEQ